LETNPQDSFAPRLFRFEVAWIRDPRCYNVIDQAWNEEVRGTEFMKLYKKLDATQNALKVWNKKVLVTAKLELMN